MPSAEYLEAIAQEGRRRRAKIEADLAARKARLAAAQASVSDADEKASNRATAS